jgi:Ni/Co efflux regulator RcnB
MNLRSLLCALLLTAFFIPTAALAQRVPSHLDDVVGERASSGEGDLRDRGYVHIETHKSSDRAYSYWWNADRHECISVTTMDGRYNDIVESSASDCNQHHDSAGEAAGAAVAVGAAALLIGAIAASASHHKSHHHENNSHRDDNDYEREFERGHRDGLYHHTYDMNDSEGYQAGYTSGAEQREHNTSHRHHSGRHNSSGYQQGISSSDLNDLRNARASSADDQLSGWGFRSVDRMMSGDTVYLVWYDRSRGQCLQETMADGRVVSIDDIGQHPACR